MCLNLSGFWPETPTYLEYWYFSDNIQKVCKQASVKCISFHILSICLIIIFFSKSSGLGGGLFSFFKGLAGQKTLTLDDINPVLDKMKEHLIGNVFILPFFRERLTPPKLFLPFGPHLMPPVMLYWPPVKTSTDNLKSVCMDICMYVTVLKNKVQHCNQLVVNVPEKLLFADKNLETSCH